MDTTERFRGILGYFTLAQTDRIESIFENIGEPVPWPSTINSWWSNLLTAMEVEWADVGNTLSDIEKPALEE